MGFRLVVDAGIVNTLALDFINTENHEPLDIRENIKSGWVCIDDAVLALNQVNIITVAVSTFANAGWITARSF